MDGVDRNIIGFVAVLDQGECGGDGGPRGTHGIVPALGHGDIRHNRHPQVGFHTGLERFDRAPRCSGELGSGT